MFIYNKDADLFLPLPLPLLTENWAANVGLYLKDGDLYIMAAGGDTDATSVVLDTDSGRWRRGPG